MELDIKKYSRKSFDVDAVQVTTANIHQVAKWCKGEVHKTTPRDPAKIAIYIQVNVIRAMSDNQTKAYVGNWVLYTNSGFKVYNDKAFHDAFDSRPPAPELKPDMALITNSGSGQNWITPEEKDALQFVTAVAKAVKEAAAS